MFHHAITGLYEWINKYWCDTAAGNKIGHFQSHHLMHHLSGTLHYECIFELCEDTNVDSIHWPRQTVQHVEVMINYLLYFYIDHALFIRIIA